MFKLLLKILILLLSSLNCCQSYCRPILLPINAVFSGQCRGIQACGAVCSINCRQGFVRQGPSTRICQRNGLWSGAPTKCLQRSCPPIRQTENGLVINLCANRYTIGCRLAFRCNNGFTLDRNQTIKCLRSGQWSAAEPKCNPNLTTPSKCPQLSIPIGGFWDSRLSSNGECSGAPGETCGLICEDGFRIVGPTYAYCDTTKRVWTQPIPYCDDD